jgi:ABC-type branched-chain amino acid transport system, permease component
MENIKKIPLVNRLFENLGPLLLVLVLPFIFNIIGFSFGLNIAIFIFLFIIVASGLDILFGYSGQMSMGHAGFYAIGAYGSALLTIYLGLPAIVTIFLAPLLAAGIGAMLAFPASKLRFHFLTLATVAFGEIIFQVIFQSPGRITNDAIGLRVPPIRLFGWILRTNNFTAIYFFLLIFVVLALTAKTNLVNSRVGRALIAVRENSHAADGMGVDVRKYKVIAFALSAFFVAMAGSLFAHTVGFINPNGFTATQSVLFVTILLFGGTASKWGPVMGAITIAILQELLRPLGNLQVLIYGVLLLTVIVAMPGGLFGSFKSLVAFIKKRGAK